MIVHVFNSGARSCHLSFYPPHLSSMISPTGGSPFGLLPEAWGTHLFFTLPSTSVFAVHFFPDLSKLPYLEPE